MLFGKSEHTVDAKGRIFFPAKWRYLMSDKVVIAKDESGAKSVGCLQCMAYSEWEKYIERFNSVTRTNEAAMGILRRLYSSAEICELDKQGRIVIPQALREYAGITDEVVSIGVLDRVELWNPERWQDYSTHVDDTYNDRIVELNAEMEKAQ